MIIDHCCYRYYAGMFSVYSTLWMVCIVHLKVCAVLQQSGVLCTAQELQITFSVHGTTNLLQ